MSASAQELYRDGQLGDAIASLSAAVRADPGDVHQRTFLFELLCFAGEYDRAERQLDVLGSADKDAGMGALLYRSALHAERRRSDLFVRDELPGGPAPGAVSGTLNGRPFASLTDADPRIGPRLELFAAGQYTWLPFEHIASITIEPPKRLRDLLWIPAHVEPSPALTGLNLGELLLPVLTPLAWQHSDNQVRLGRVTDWRQLASALEVPVGQKLLLMDGEEVPVLEIRRIEITTVPAAAS